ncbi:hypothetical protein ROX22_003431 [Serratia marcescens]|nr:hypothetical protein [Serratia marcescens]
MSTEKLSELSKPVAWEVKGILCHSEEEARVYVGEPEPLYSQEYVSALDKVAQFWIGESAGWKKRAEDAEKRIAELEGQLQSGFTPEALAQEERAENAEQRVAELEAKLATPVRLKKVDSSNVPYAGDGFNAAVDYCADRVRAAGFKIEGDE